MAHVDGFCMVICGQWCCAAGGEWSFFVDKEKQSRIVPVFHGMTVECLHERISTEFGVSNCSGVSLSYWSPTSLEFTTGSKTPPVMVTTNVALDYYLKLCTINKGLNMFVNFAHLSKRVTPAEDSQDAQDEGQTSSGTGRKRACVPDECGYLSTAGSKVLPGVSETEDFLAELDKVESVIGCKRGPIVSEVDVSCSCDSDVSCTCGSEPLSDNRPIGIVAPAGYDREFWSNFIEEDLGGSNVVEVMCTGNGVFDHSVIMGGNSVGQEHAAVEIKPTDPNPIGQSYVDERRKLNEIDDEEFDIPPLFDDTEYERDEIPDLDRDDSDGVYKGKVFANREDCQIGLAIYAIKNMFHFRQMDTKRHSFVAICSDRKCDWRVLAREMPESGYYEIRKAHLEHTCSIETRRQYMKKATSRVIASVYKAKFKEPVSGPKPMDLQQLILEDLRVTASYAKCWRAREKAVDDVNLCDDDAYFNLPEYLHLLKISNPGTIADIETDVEEDGSERFLYMFLAFGASIQGFKSLRRILVVDGTHLIGKFKGVLLTASGQDANYQVFPLAFAVVDSENDSSWTWFLQKLERIIADSPSVTIISDRHQSIYVAKQRVFPLAHHAACIVHIERNVVARFKNKGLAAMVKNAACSFTVAGFKKIYKDITSRNSECAKYLEDIGLAHWSRVYFRGERFNLMTSNIAESLNKALKAGRGSPIIELLKFIREMLTRWFSARRKKSQRHTELVPPYVDKVMTKHMSQIKGSKIGSVSSWSYEIIGKFGERHHVLLDEKRCNCKTFDRLKIPCGHAMLAADSLGIPYGTLVADWFKTPTWVATYRGVVNPEADAGETEIPTAIRNRQIHPPRTRRPSGRPPKSRIPSIGEFKKKKTPRVNMNRCTRCQRTGHNRVRCTNPI